MRVNVFRLEMVRFYVVIEIIAGCGFSVGLSNVYEMGIEFVWVLYSHSSHHFKEAVDSVVMKVGNMLRFSFQFDGVSA